ncbi:hypothetical protein HYQ46_001221 [Verticillium longisporum]|nr:hypothetical protein HYQ46_001221 [Verticillium longisporum]
MWIRRRPLWRYDIKLIADRERAGIHARKANQMLWVLFLLFLLRSVIVEVDFLECGTKVVDGIVATDCSLSPSRFGTLLPREFSCFFWAKLSRTSLVLRQFAFWDGDHFADVGNDGV